MVSQNYVIYLFYFLCYYYFFFKYPRQPGLHTLKSVQCGSHYHLKIANKQSENDNYVMNMKCSTFLLILLYWNLPQQIIKRVKKEGFTKEYSDNHSFNSFIIRICGLPFVPNLLISRALILLERRLETFKNVDNTFNFSSDMRSKLCD